jgi:hypothetical protein
MYYILGSDNKEYGPIGSEVVLNWFEEKRIDSKTMIRREGETDWKIFSSIPEFSYLMQPSARQHENVSADPLALQAQVESRGVHVDAMDCVRRSYALYKNNFGPILIATLLITVILMGSGSIPGGFLLNGILYGGLYWFFLKWMREGKAELGDAFAGFQRQPGQLVLAGLVTGFVPVLLMIIVCLPFFIPFFLTAAGSASSGADPGSLLQGLGILGCVGMLIGALAAFVLYVMWMFAYPLIIDKGLKFWPAMELSRKTVMKSFFGYVWLNILCGLLIFGGLLACIVGIFFVAPICAGAFAYAYEDVFGSSRT